MARFLRPLLAVCGSMRRHPGRSLVALLLLALVGVGLTLAGPQVWAFYHLRAARTSLDRYHNAEAADHLRACMEVWPNDPDVLLLAARVARRAGSFDEAAELLERCQRQRGRDDNVIVERILLTVERGDMDEVMKFCMAKVETNDPVASLVLEALARGYRRRFRLAEADAAIQTWLEREPNNPMALLLLGRMAQDHSADTEAAAAYRHALEIDPDLDEARDRLSEMLIDTHQVPEARPHLEYLARRHPDDAGLTVRLAQCRDLLGQQDEAARLLDDLLARRPECVPALAQRGKLALRAGQRAEAEQWLRQAVALAPADATLLPHFKRCLEENEHYDEAQALEPRIKQALTDLERIQTLVNKDLPEHHDNADLWYEGAAILLRAGSTSEGRYWLENAVRLNPKHVKAHEALAESYKQSGDALKAAKHQKMARDAAAAAAKQ
jgi:tetratricopeptide (TPR) repeat protein